MIIGCPKEIKIQEYRVGLTPEGVDALVRQGHEIYIETNAGMGSGFSDDAYKEVGARILNTAKEVYEIAEMIIKVKEPLAVEFPYIKSGQILFTMPPVQCQCGGSACLLFYMRCLDRVCTPDN
jgi:alanine dehydrogenase